MQEPLTPAQRRTLPARQALARKFKSPEAKSQHYREMATKANAGRVILSASEAATLAHLSDFLRCLVERDQHPQRPRTAREEAASVA